ncbi:MAG: PTS sugar transporter subunit IIA [Treponema sp.]|jgi:PTS system fructose-specific IIC component/PTS system nitrogen regulatory IIA component|nr:PTS sugar transporter subunit IIA [Treponema sp.]
MLLTDVFPPELIKIGLEAEDKDEAFEEIIDQFCQVKKIKNRREILEAIYERESKMSTGIHKGIAIPHGKTNALDDICGFLAISRKGIDYDALDGQPVYILFMILAPQKDSEQHLRLLKRLADFLDNPHFYAELLAQPDSKSAHKIIKKYEDIFIAS